MNNYAGWQNTEGSHQTTEPRHCSYIHGAVTDYIYIMHNNNIFVKGDLKFLKRVVLNIDVLYTLYFVCLCTNNDCN